MLIPDLFPPPSAGRKPPVVGQLDQVRITNPKRGAGARKGWEGFFPYYAGYPEEFVIEAIKSLDLPNNSLVCDPWNGSGTTTSACTVLGLPSWGIDLNPAMVIVAKARLLPSSEADSLQPLCREILSRAKRWKREVRNDALSAWFEEQTAGDIRRLEMSIRHHLIGGLAATGSENRLLHMSTLAAAFYVALFSTCRHYLGAFKTANPTWLRDGSRTDLRVSVPREVLHQHLAESIARMAKELAKSNCSNANSFCPSVLEVGDTSKFRFKPNSIDLVITSPPYCTRLDYVASTRIELAVVQPWLSVSASQLSSQMTGTVKVPKVAPVLSDQWGNACIEFLNRVKCHPSKASDGYYFKNHTDYFDKLYRSMQNISIALKAGGAGIFVVQDSFYKEIHNPLPDILTEMAENLGLQRGERKNFPANRSMSTVNLGSRAYRTHQVPTEAVACFSKPN